MMKTTEDKIGVASGEAHHRTKYPFDFLPLGMCFTLPIEGTNEVSIRNQATRWKQKSGKEFTVIKHAKHSCFEVARIA